MLKRRLSLVTLLLLIAVSYSSRGFAATYYVSPAGNDANDGTSLSTPWKTLRFAGTNVAPGDTVLMRGGAYVNDHLSIPPRQASKAAPITFQAYNNEIPVLTGTPTYGTMASTAGAWIILDGLHIENTTTDIDLDVQSTNTVITNCAFKNNTTGSFIRLIQTDRVTISNCSFDTTGIREDNGQGSAVYNIGSTHVLIEHNYFTRLGHAAVDIWKVGSSDATGTVVRQNLIEQHWGGGLYCGGNGTGVVFEDNVIRYVGEQVPYSKAGILLECTGAIARRNIIYKTTATGNPDDAITVAALTWGGNLNNTINNRIYNNTVYKAGRSPLALAQRDVASNTGNKIINNIFYHSKLDCATGTCSPDYWPPGNYYIVLTSAVPWKDLTNGNFIYNNIIEHADASGDRPTDPTLFADSAHVGYFKTYSLEQAQQAGRGLVFGNLSFNPQLSDPDNGDYTLQPGSPAIDAGAHLAQAIAAGSSTTILPVDDPYFFTDGYGITPGDSIRVGNNPPVTISSIDYANKRLTLSSAISFSAGDYVDLDYYGIAPDIGAVEYLGSAADANWLKRLPGPAKYPHAPAK